MAPYNIWPFFIVGFSILFCTIHHAKSGWRAFAYGWLFSFGYLVFGLSWIGNALLVEGNPYKWAWPLAVSGLPAYLAIYAGLAAVLAHRFLNLKSVSGWLAFAALLCLGEWLRGFVFTGFPWNTYGYTWIALPYIAQVASLSDVYLLSLLTILWGCAPAFLLLAERRSAVKGFFITLLSIAVCIFYGGWRYSQNDHSVHEDINIRIVQPNIPQHEKWQLAKTAEHFNTLLSLSAGDAQKTTFVIWPETALNFRMMSLPGAEDYIGKMLGSYPAGSALLTGMMRYEQETEIYANSLVMFDQTGSMQNIYDKHHLVPFGEYIPFQKWIPLEPVVQFKGFQAGKGAQSFDLGNGLAYSPLVCYEIIFPGQAYSHNHPVPDVIINVTNDAWYGISAGPHQHLTQAAFRAIETGVPVIRATNTGISAVISPFGEITGRTPLFERVATDIPLPMKNTVFYASYKFKYIIFLLILFGLFFAGYKGKKRRTN